MSADKGLNAAGILKKWETERGNTSQQDDSTHTTMEFETENELKNKRMKLFTQRVRFEGQSSSDELPDRVHKIVGFKRRG